ncbi:MAG: VTT domain-containing protein [Candidatus Saccharibacteria bacterium]
MIPGFDLTQFAQTAGPIAALVIVALIIFAESGLLIGFFLPGDSILFTLGFLIQGSTSFRLDININLAILVLFAAAVIGDNVGYTFGRKLGPRLFSRPNSLLFRQENVQKAQEFYEQYGGKTIIIARFVPIVRTFAPLIAGVAKMKYKTFVTFNMIGGLLWTAGITYLGFFLGQLMRNIGIDIDTVLLPFIALILVVSITPALYHLLKDKKQRQVIWNSTKLEIKKIFNKNK